MSSHGMDPLHEQAEAAAKDAEAAEKDAEAAAKALAEEEAADKSRAEAGAAECRTLTHMFCFALRVTLVIVTRPALSSSSTTSIPSFQNAHDSSSTAHIHDLLYFLGHPEQVIWRQVDARCASSIHSGDRSGVRGMGGSQVAQIVSQRVESGRDKDEFRVESA